MKRMILLACAVLTLGILLTSCSPAKNTGDTSGTSSDKKPESSQSQPSESETQQTVEGVINKIDTYLVLLTDDGEYQVMDYGEGVTIDDFFEGNRVKITYTGKLGDENSTPVMVAIEKVETDLPAQPEAKPGA